MTDGCILYISVKGTIKTDKHLENKIKEPELMFHVKHLPQTIKERTNMKTSTKDFTAVVMEKKATLEVLEELMDKLSTIEENTRKEWGYVGEVQKTRWCEAEDTILPVYLDEEGNETFEVTKAPKIVNDYDFIEKKEFTSQDEAKFRAIEKICETLANLA